MSVEKMGKNKSTKPGGGGRVKEYEGPPGLCKLPGTLLRWYLLFFLEVSGLA
jgi:hypothetical protein